ncbi:hypothetical protein SKAU_G00081800 [Synaphobranchus kaupii]|uniref:Uncharacterized protein n=1 Tax=Synaphobranchus kaupii TaxID=118154 RepID=A0A9Q1FV99_SYNKA|nr:hypothetical protein SKAU_G00081800 [Synaphobranchus kaupii]
MGTWAGRPSHRHFSCVVKRLSVCVLVSGPGAAGRDVLKQGTMWMQRVMTHCSERASLNGPYLPLYAGTFQPIITRTQAALPPPDLIKAGQPMLTSSKLDALQSRGSTALEIARVI